MFYCVKIYNNFINKISLLNTVFCNSNNLNNSFYNQYEKYFNNYVIEFDNIIFNNKKEKIINLINMKFNITSDNIYSFYELFDRWAKYINNFNDIDFKNEIINTIDYIKYFIDKYIDNKFEDNILIDYFNVLYHMYFLNMYINYLYKLYKIKNIKFQFSQLLRPNSFSNNNISKNNNSNNNISKNNNLNNSMSKLDIIKRLSHSFDNNKTNKEDFNIMNNKKSKDDFNILNNKKNNDFNMIKYRYIDDFNINNNLNKCVDIFNKKDNKCIDNLNLLNKRNRDNDELLINKKNKFI